jgi:hypothetical protein
MTFFDVGWGHDVRRAIVPAVLAVLAFAGAGMAYGAGGGSGSARDPAASAPAVGPLLFGAAPAGEMDVELAWGMVVDCSGPEVPFTLVDFHYTLQGVLRLARDGSASLVLTAVVRLLPVWTVQWAGRLGGEPTQAPGGTMELRVVSAHDLRAIWRQPTSDFVLDVDLSGTEAGADACRLAVSTPLHPGQTAYSSCSAMSCAKCSAMRAGVATCTAR